MQGLTSIILVTHNQLDYTKLCVESIEGPEKGVGESAGWVAGA